MNEDPTLDPSMRLPWDPPEMWESNDSDNGNSDGDVGAEPVEHDTVQRAEALLNAEEPAGVEADSEAEAVEAEPVEDSEADPIDDSTEEDQPRRISLSELRDVEIVDESGKALGRPIPQSEWTKKTQRLAEQRKETENIMSTYAAALEVIAQASPEKAQAAAAEMERVRGDFERLHKSQHKALQRDAVESFMDQHSISAGDLPKELARLDKAARSYGFSAEQLAEISDARLLNVLHDAAEYRRLVKEQGEVRSKVVRPDSKKVIRPKARSRHPQTGKRSPAYRAAVERHSREGSVQSATAVAAFLMGGDD